MTRFTIRCLTRSLWRVLFALFLLLALTEFALLVTEDRGESRLVFRVVHQWFSGEIPAAILGSDAAEPVSWWRATIQAAFQSGKAFGLALAMTLGLGLPLGILSARWRRWVLLEILISPLFIVAMLPGFWVACVLVWWQIESPGLPGFASSGEGVRGWWDAFLVAAIVAPPAIAWQIRSIGWSIRKKAKDGHVWGALSRGLTGSRLFYRHVFSSALDPVIRSLDRVLPAMLGGQLIVEWMFRYPGLGTLMIESARSGYHAGTLAGGVALSVIVVLFRFAGEWILGASDRRGREDLAATAA